MPRYLPPCRDQSVTAPPNRLCIRLFTAPLKRPVSARFDIGSVSLLSRQLTGKNINFRVQTGGFSGIPLY